MEVNQALTLVKSKLTYDEIMSVYAMWCNNQVNGERKRKQTNIENEKINKTPKTEKRVPAPPERRAPRIEVVEIKLAGEQKKPRPKAGKGTQRGHLKWTDEENDALIKGIQEFGAGDWKTIREKYHQIFDVNDRNRTDLSRRWQTLKEQGKYKELWDRVSAKHLPRRKNRN